MKLQTTSVAGGASSSGMPSTNRKTRVTREVHITAPKCNALEN